MLNDVNTRCNASDGEGCRIAQFGRNSLSVCAKQQVTLLQWSNYQEKLKGGTFETVDENAPKW